ncbi:MAG TPA: sulfite exporter TauE/SafE family protein [Calditrichaeota bacterium]|nr:sulfite exporter TauE/SafE family protein [Calditrichota bacterium]
MNFVFIFALILVFLAYFVKGFSGFGPALILVPTLSMLYDPQTAISVAALFDCIAGPLLLWSVRKKIDWKFISVVFIVLSFGAFIGVRLMTYLSIDVLKKLIGAAILVFAVLLFSQNHSTQKTTDEKRWARWAKYPFSFVAGLSGGLLGITGPPLVIFMKFTYDKAYFRNQLIAIFTFGAFWRFFLYQTHDIQINISLIGLLIMIAVLLAALWLGNYFQSRADETKFNRIIALILLLPALNLLISN